jgi:hypothetical protein
VHGAGRHSVVPIIASGNGVLLVAARTQYGTGSRCGTITYSIRVDVRRLTQTVTDSVRARLAGYNNNLLVNLKPLWHGATAKVCSISDCKISTYVQGTLVSF